MTKIVATLSVCILIAGSTAAFAKSDPIAKCAAAKRKAAGKKGGALLACSAKVIGKGSTTPDPACTDKAVNAFEASFAKAEAKAACPGTTTDIETQVDDCVTSALDLTSAQTGKCAGGKAKGASKALSGQLVCHAKQATKPDPTGLDDCLAKAHAKIEKAVDKADGAKDGPCAGSAESFETLIDGCTQAIADALPAGGSSTTTSTLPTTTTVPGSTSTSTTLAGSTTTTSTSTTSTSTSSTSTSSTVISSTTSTSTTSTTVGSAVCGNGTTEVGETCDDHNSVDESDVATPILPTDNCPKNCVIGACGAGTETAQTVAVNFTVPAGAPQVFGITVFVDYPDAKADLTGSGAGVTGSISNVNPGALNQPNDLDYGLLDGLVSLSGLTGTKLFDLTLQRCPGLPPLTAGDFTCLVKDASDQSANTIAGVTCTVVP